MSYRVVQHNLSVPPKRVYPRYLVKEPVPRGRQVMRGGSVDGLGFSLKPPKWLRKAQPGKILAKAALPAAAIGAALLLPGVGAAVAGGLMTAGGAIARTATGVAKIATGIARPVTAQVSPIVTLAKQASPVLKLLPTMPGGVPQGSSPSTPTVIALQPQAPAPFVPSSGGGSYGTAVTDAGAQATQTSAVSEGLPGWVIPAGIAAVVLLVSRRR